MKKNSKLNENSSENSNLTYELVGVVIHSGTAPDQGKKKKKIFFNFFSPSGHYYSLIKERNFVDFRANRWFRFDDSLVSPFNPTQIPEECFGNPGQGR